MNKIIKICCISIVLISLVSVNYFFYLKKEHKENDVDISYYDNLVNEAIETISTYGDYEWFVS